MARKDRADTAATWADLLMALSTLHECRLVRASTSDVHINHNNQLAPKFLFGCQVFRVLGIGTDAERLGQDAACSATHLAVTITFGAEEILCIPLAQVIGMLRAQICLGVEDNLGKSHLAHLVELSNEPGQ